MNYRKFLDTFRKFHNVQKFFLPIFLRILRLGEFEIVGNIAGTFLSALSHYGTGFRILPFLKLEDKKRRWLECYMDLLSESRRKKILVRFMYLRKLRNLRRKVRMKMDGSENTSFPSCPLPGLILLSIGGDCNLSCRGCLSQWQKGGGMVEVERVDFVLKEIQSLDVPYVSIVGSGEPFLDSSYTGRLLDCLKRYKMIDFIIFTNGTTINNETARQISMATNIFLFVSIDGFKENHDARRGSGTFDRVMASLRYLKNWEVPFGFSVTVNSLNWREVTSHGFIEEMVKTGALVGLYIEFFSREYSNLKLKLEERCEYRSRIQNLAESSPVVLIDLFSFEEKLYGCRAGKGKSCFIDASTGMVYPCVAFPFTGKDCNIYEGASEGRLREILSGKFFTAYREAHNSCRNCVENVEGEMECYSNLPGIRFHNFEDLIIINN